MFAYCDELVDYVCQNNRHVRDMVKLAHVAAKHGLEASPVQKANAWIAGFISDNRHQAALFAKRGWL